MTAHLPPRPPARRIVIVGTGLAGLRTAAELRGQGFDGELTVLGAEAVAPYDRPPLSKELFSRPDPVWLVDEGYGDLAVLADRLLPGHRAHALREASPEGVIVTVAGPTGAVEEVAADVVVVASGARPVRRPGWTGVRTLHDVGDARRLRELLLPGTELVVIGAGWIGGELATVAADREVSVTLLEAASGPLAHVLGPQVSALLPSWYEAAGVDLRCDTLVTSTDRRGAVLTDGSRLPADLVVAAVGVRPNTEWLAGTVPLTARGAIPVDLQGGVLGGPNSVRAVGDCTDRSSPRDGVLPGAHWDGALSHPELLVADLLGHEPPTARFTDPSPYVFSTQLGHELAVVGAAPAGSRVLLRGDPAADDGWTALYVEPGADGLVQLRAGFTVDRPRDVSPLRRALSAAQYPMLDPVGAVEPATPLRRALAR